ncbi:hypothetical protein D3C76_1203610 [compost metagenome]
MIVTRAPATSNDMPCSLIAVSAAGPASRPTTAPKAVRPNSEKAHCAAAGRAPNSGCRELYQPISKPASRIPPPIPNSTGIMPIWVDNSPTSEPSTKPRACRAMSLR